MMAVVLCVVVVVAVVVVDAQQPECAFRCAGGKVARARLGHKPTSNGCGTAQIRVDVTPFAGLELCCNAHDMDYDTCGVSRAESDRFRGQCASALGLKFVCLTCSCSFVCARFVRSTKAPEETNATPRHNLWVRMHCVKQVCEWRHFDSFSSALQCWPLRSWGVKHILTRKGLPVNVFQRRQSCDEIGDAAFRSARRSPHWAHFMAR